MGGRRQLEGSLINGNGCKRQGKGKGRRKGKYKDKDKPGTGTRLPPWMQTSCSTDMHYD